MYKLVIILRYLRRKLIPLFAAGAVTLCTAMVIIVISVMGGFLNMMKSATKTLEGDLIISADLSGFPHYAEMMEGLAKLPEAQASAPIVRAYGLVKLHGSVHTVEVLGIDPPSLDKVVSYRKTLFWGSEHYLKAIDADLRASPPPDARQEQQLREYRRRWERLDLRQFGMTLQPPAEWQNRVRGAPAPGSGGGDGPTTGAATRPADLPGIVLGLEVSPYNIRDGKGQYDVRFNRSLSHPMTLTVLPITQQGGLREPQAREMIVVNEFKSGLYEIDANRVYVSFAVLQQMLRMDAYPEVDDNLNPTGRVIPGRASGVMVRGKDGVALDALQKAVSRFLGQFSAAHPGMPPVEARTYLERHATYLGAVENEKGLVTILFGIISVVAVLMIAVIFYMIVLEKTRDIGTLRAIGASRLGITAVFLGYGLAIGIVGAVLGFALGGTIVWKINELQALLGLKIWNPKVYYFDRVPNQIDPTEVALILVAAVISSVLGSVIPAYRAGRLNPVEALRYE